MNADAVRQIVEREASRGLTFKNLHGITPGNLASHLVEPFTVRVDPDDLETNFRDMWVVLQERSDPRDGYVVVFDSEKSRWGVAEYQSEDHYTLVIGASSLAEALDGM